MLGVTLRASRLGLLASHLSMRKGSIICMTLDQRSIVPVRRIFFCRRRTP